MDEIEIPEVITDGGELPRKSNLALFLPFIIGGMFCLGIGGLLWMFVFSSPEHVEQSTPSLTNKQEASSVAPKLQSKSPQPNSQPVAPKTVASGNGAKTATRNPSKTKPNQAKISQGDLLGHLPYDVAPQSELVAITADGSLQLRAAAAEKFEQMQAAAQADGVNLTVISAFRTTKAQEELFFGVKEQRVQDATKRAEVSAPPGYSEHHTGYAVDLGDGSAPGTNLEKEFANTAASNWLKQNALKYSFELSFPLNNQQGVSYEPWHWRFVGDRNSLETFYKARK